MCSPGGIWGGGERKQKCLSRQSGSMKVFFFPSFFTLFVSPGLVLFARPDRDGGGGNGRRSPLGPPFMVSMLVGSDDNYRVGRAHYQAAAVRPAALAGKHDGLDLRALTGANTGWLNS